MTGQTAENVSHDGIGREQGPLGRAAGTSQGRSSGFFEREITPVAFRTLSVQHRRRCDQVPPRKVSESAGFPAEWHRDHGNRSRQGRRGGDLRRKAKVEATPLARIVSHRGQRTSGDHGQGRSGVKESAERAGTASRRDLVEINRPSQCRSGLGARSYRHRRGQAQHQVARSPRSPAFGMSGRAHHHTLLNSLQTYDKTFGLETMCR